MQIKHKEKIEQMTLEEKASLMSGANFWNTKSIDHADIPSIMLTDGPHGLRKQGGKADHLGLNKSKPATCFPTAATLANSWDICLLEEVGRCLGREAAMESVSVLLGPGLNIKRNPLCGRNFEYFSEDPYLSGKLAAAMTKGIQSEGVAACPKHFAVNSQETHRMLVDEIVDERALHELYLEAFRILVREARPKTMMTSYNKVNGVYANENEYLLKDVLRKAWGYEGVLVSDWGGNNDRVEALRAGSTLEMPSTSGVTDAEIVMAVKKGYLSEEVLDEQVDRFLTLLDETARNVLAKEIKDKQEEMHRANHIKAVDAACRSMVLLKNEGKLLPFTNTNQKVAVIGDFAEKPRYQGAGSSLVVPTKLPCLKDELKQSGINVIGYEPGFKRYGKKHEGLLKQAVDLARKADLVCLFLGLDESSEAEGVDRAHMQLSGNQIELIKKISEIGTPIVLILAGGSPIEMPFIHEVQAILHGYLPGQGGAEALVKILLGKYNPSGKLAETYPIKYEDVASASFYPGEELTSEHRESIFIGYRHYDAGEQEVLFPFGFGLSYTSFAYRGMKIESDKKDYVVKVTVENTGDCKGEEIVQIYVAPKNRKVFHEKKGLKGFAKVALKPGERKEVSIALSDHAFSYYHIGRRAWVAEKGEYEILAGTSSREILLRETIDIEGVEVDNPYTSDVCFDFNKLLGRELPEAYWNRAKTIDEHDLIEQARYGGRFGQFIYRFILFVHRFYLWREKPILANNVLFVLGLPFRSVSRMSGGRFSRNRLDGLLMMVNGHFFKGLWQLIIAKGQKQNGNWEVKGNEATKGN
jgi:beta-glucosidase